MRESEKKKETENFFHTYPAPLGQRSSRCQPGCQTQTAPNQPGSSGQRLGPQSSPPSPVPSSGSPSAASCASPGEADGQGWACRHRNGIMYRLTMPDGLRELYPFLPHQRPAIRSLQHFNGTHRDTKVRCYQVVSESKRFQWSHVTVAYIFCENLIFLHFFFNLDGEG